MRPIAALMSFIFCLVLLGAFLTFAGGGGIGTTIAALILGPLTFFAPAVILWNDSTPSFRFK